MNQLNPPESAGVERITKPRSASLAVTAVEPAGNPSPAADLYPEQANGSAGGMAVTLRRLGGFLPWFILTGLALYFFLPLLASFEHSLTVIRGMTPWLLVLALLMVAASYVGAGYMLTSLMGQGTPRLSMWRAVLISLGSYSVGLVAGGMVASGAATYRWLNQHGSQREWAAIAGVLPSALITLVLSVMSLFGMVYLFISQRLTSLQVTAFAISMLPTLALAAVLILGSAYRPKVETLAEWISRRWAKLWKKEYRPGHSRRSLAEFYFAWEMLKGGKWQKPLLGALIYCVLNMLALYFVFLAAGYPLHFSILLTGYGLPLLFGRAAFFLPGGVGVIESSMAALYTSLGVPSAMSVVVVLAYRLISFWIPALAGVPAVMILQKGKKLS